MHKTREHGFSLMELIVALALGLILLYVVGTTLSNASRATNQTMAQMNLHTSAQAIIKRLKMDVESIHPSGIPKVEYSSPIRTLWLPVCLPNLDPDSDGTDLPNELAWISYEYDETDKILKRSIWQEPNGGFSGINKSNVLPSQVMAINVENFEFDDALEFNIQVAAGEITPLPVYLTFIIELNDANTGTKRTFTYTGLVPGN